MLIVHWARTVEEVQQGAVAVKLSIFKRATVLVIPSALQDTVTMGNTLMGKFSLVGISIAQHYLLQNGVTATLFFVVLAVKEELEGGVTVL